MTKTAAGRAGRGQSAAAFAANARCTAFFNTAAEEARMRIQFTVLQTPSY
jgi:hypothetical protein